MELPCISTCISNCHANSNCISNSKNPSASLGFTKLRSWDSADSGTTFWSFDWQCHGKRTIYRWSSCLTWRNIQFAMPNDQSLGGWDYILWYLLVACSFQSFSMSYYHILPVACLKKMKPNLCCLHPHCDRSPSMLHRTMWLCFNPGILLEPHLYQ